MSTAEALDLACDLLRQAQRSQHAVLESHAERGFEVDDLRDRLIKLQDAEAILEDLMENLHT